MLTHASLTAKLKVEAINMSAAIIDLANVSTGLVLPVKVASENRVASFLMCPPRLYNVNYVINPWMAGNVHAASRERATEQWNLLYEQVSRIADVKLVEPQPGSPDMVFTANAGLLHGNVVAISSFFHPERQGEELHFREWFRENGYKILDIARETPFEGEGDALFSEDGLRLWVGYGLRTVKSSHQTLRDVLRVEVISVELIDPRFYHLDTCFAPLAGGHVMYFPAAFSDAAVKAIEDYYPIEKRVVVDETDAVRFACNAVNVDRKIILNRISGKLSMRLESLGFEVVQVELSEFLRAGGAAKCLVMKLRAS